MSRPGMQLGALCAILCAGCGVLSPNDAEIPDIPMGVKQVEEMSASFRQDATHPLHDVATGTLIDDVAGIDGCWGAFESFGDGPLAANARFLRFDVADGRLNYMVLQRGADLLGLVLGGTFDTLQSADGNFQMASENSIAIQFTDTEIAVSPNVTQSLDGAGANPLPIPELDLDEFTTLLITLDGDVLKTSLDEGVLYYRFDCPQ